MNDHNPVTPVDDTQENTAPTPAQSPHTPPPLDEAAITAQVEQRLRRQLAELTEIAAQAKRLGVTVDPAQALARGVTPDALRQSPPTSSPTSSSSMSSSSVWSLGSVV